VTFRVFLRITSMGRGYHRKNSTTSRLTPASQYVARQALALREFLEFGVNVRGIHGYRRSRVPGGVER
jgi:hypothetical protein